MWCSKLKFGGLTGLPSNVHTRLRALSAKCNIRWQDVTSMLGMRSATRPCTCQRNTATPRWWRRCSNTKLKSTSTSLLSVRMTFPPTPLTNHCVLLSRWVGHNYVNYIVTLLTMHSIYEGNIKEQKCPNPALSFVMSPTARSLWRR